MKLKLFGREIFEFTRRGGAGGLLFESARKAVKDDDFLPDFLRFSAGGINFRRSSLAEEVEVSFDEMVERAKGRKKAKKKMKVEEKEEVTPKGVFELKLLHDEKYRVNCDPEYVDKQLEDFKEKLSLLDTKEDMRRGVVEISSIILRMENRKRYDKFKAFFEEYSYTVNSRIEQVLKDNKHLRIDKVEQFLADMPNEAVRAMKGYTRYTKDLCSKKPIFYIIANKKDFEKTSMRKDPILLAQSPFGHVWQILGAWDEEMLLLEEL